MPNNNLHIDRVLLHQISEGNEQAFRVLFDYYKNRFYNVALKMTRQNHIAEETVQEVFLNIWRNKASIIDIDNPDAYFFTMLYRQVYQHFKKVAIDKKLLYEAPLPSQVENLTEQAILGKESQRLLDEAISKLPPQQQAIYKLNKIEGFSYFEIAEKLNISPNTVRNHLAAAVKSIRISLRHLGDFALIFGIFIWLFFQK